MHFNPLNPHDALKHHLESQKNKLISWNLVVLERKFSLKLKKNSIFFHLSPTLSHFHPLQVENCGSNSRLVVDENDSGKFRLQRVKVMVYHGLPDIMHISINNERKSAIFNLIRLNFSKHIPSWNLTFCFMAVVCYLWHGLPDIRHVKVNNGRKSESQVDIFQGAFSPETSYFVLW